MKNILIITPYCPYPSYKSGGIHALLNIIKQNNNFGNKIDLIYYDEKDENGEKELKKYFNNIQYIDLRKKDKYIRFESILRRIPYGIYQYNEKLLEVNNYYDKVIFDQPLSMNMVEYIDCKDKVLIAYDSMSLYFQRKARINKFKIINNIYNIIQSKLYKIIQKKQYEKFNKVFFVSKDDANYEKNQLLISDDIIDYINLGVDFEKFKNNCKKVTNKKNIIFTGIMSYAPNKDAALYFAKEVFPEILKENDDIKFLIVGKNPDKELMDLANDNIVVTGFVDDIVEYINSSDVYVSPLRYGTGMKNKILEAMSCEKAIVASSISVEGIDFLEDNKNIFIANSKEEWIDKVNILLKDEKKNLKFSKECRKIIVENFNWRNSYKKIIG